MKTISTLQKYLTRMMVIALIFISKESFSQPDYSFAGATLLSGTNLQVGAVYKFTNVRPGIDARLTISAKSPGIGLTELDGASGYPATLQPTITATPWTSGYVEFSITFYTGGTTSTMVQPLLPVTCIDVDGVKNADGAGHDLHEFDQINMGGGYTDFNTVGGELSITQVGNWFTGTNISGVDYPGRDTSAQQVMFSVINANVTSLIIRVGVNNQTATSASRLRSVYFKKFTYQNSILALNENIRLRRERNNPSSAAFKVYPTSIQGTATISVDAEQDGWATFEVVDYSGRVILTHQLIVDKGSNNIPFFNSSKMSKGNYVAVLKMDGKIYNQKIMKQY